MLDVLLVLLIFFMVSTSFKDEARLRVQLPQAQGEEAPAQETEQIRILIDQSGNFFVDDGAVVDRDPLTLVRALNGALGERTVESRDLPVLIQADANTPHQAVMTAMDAAAEVGLRRIAFAATRGGGAVGRSQAGGADGAP
jgi:biopolymer transport protein ExbD